MSGQRAQPPSANDGPDEFQPRNRTPLNASAFSVPLFPNVPSSGETIARRQYPIPDMLSNIVDPFHLIVPCRSPDDPSGPDDLPQAISGIDEQNVKWIGLDVGESCTKIAYVSLPSVKKPDYHAQKYVDGVSVQLHLARFDSSKLDAVLKFIRTRGLRELHVTGEAFNANREKFKEGLPSTCKVIVDDDTECIVNGANFLLRFVPSEVFKESSSFDRQRSTPNDGLNYVFPVNESNTFPYLLVHISSDVTIVKVESETQFERVGSFSLRASSFWKLESLLTGPEAGQVDQVESDLRMQTACSFEEISGSGYTNLPETIQLSDGAVHDTDLKLDPSAPPNKLAVSILQELSKNIVQLAGKHAASVKRIYFTGNFMRSRPISIHLLRLALDFRTKGQMKPYFFRHDGYLGALGALRSCVHSAEVVERKEFDEASWEENFACSALPNESLGVQNHVAFDRIDCSLVACPLLASPDVYIADREDLVKNDCAREYWLKTFWKSMDSVCAKAARSWPDLPHVTTKSNVAMLRYRQLIEYLWQYPSTFGPLSVRSLLDMREQCLLQCGFVDPFMKEKKQEVAEALALLPALLATLDNQKFDERWDNLTLGILQGNVFDYGAQAVVSERLEAKERNIQFGFANVRERIQNAKCVEGKRADWIARIKDRADRPYRKVAVFVDNCGFDLVLGVIPFARELLKNEKTTLILCANLRPALNDVTIEELRIISPEIAAVDEVWRRAVAQNRVVLLDSGQGSPCLDLTRVNSDTSKMLGDCDLLIIEGMGRAIHTNYSVRDCYEGRCSSPGQMKIEFTCDSIRAAVLKTPFVAESLGGRIYDYVFYFTCGKQRDEGGLAEG